MIDLNEAPAKDRWMGRLDGHLDGFEALLNGQGNAKAIVRQKIKLLAGFSVLGWRGRCCARLARARKSISDGTWS